MNSRPCALFAALSIGLALLAPVARSADWTFVRGKADEATCVARRLLEQQSQELSLGEPQQEQTWQPEQQ